MKIFNWNKSRLIQFTNLLVLCILILAFACTNAPQDQNRENSKRETRNSTNEQKQQRQASNEKEVTIQVLENEKGWGYEIKVNGELMINQPTIPVVEGTKGFDTRQDAIKAAELMKSKIKQGIMPPTITKQELDSLNIYKDIVKSK